jgi:hypothetical protein
MSGAKMATKIQKLTMASPTAADGRLNARIKLWVNFTPPE